MRYLSRCIVTLIISVVLAVGLSVPATAVPPASTVSTPELDQARERALTLEADIEEIQASQVAIDGRIDVTNQRIFKQQEVLAQARDGLDAAKQTYRDRVVRIYKSQVVDPLSILLSAESFGDFYARAFMLSRISQRDKAAYRNAAIATAEAEYQAAYLDELKRQDVELRQIRRLSLAQLKEALEEQNTLIETLTEEALEELRTVQVTNRQTRKQWLDSSVPIGAPIEMKQATVAEHPGITYTVPVHQPDVYRTTGRVETMVCSWYGNEFNGRPTASGQIFNEEDLTCASRTLPFGTRLALTRGNLRIIVVVTDRGPFIDGRDLDLSKAAARMLGFSGVEPVQAEFVTAAQ